ncbi:MAG TPA: hypothetical protein VFY87_19190 [Geminicoccaceae bacterium]|nr:hypothetical protein [Geminicoccaceae bacterium]
MRSTRNPSPPERAGQEVVEEQRHVGDGVQPVEAGARAQCRQQHLPFPGPQCVAQRRHGERRGEDQRVDRPQQGQGFRPVRLVHQVEQQADAEAQLQRQDRRAARRAPRTA